VKIPERLPEVSKGHSRVVDLKARTAGRRVQGATRHQRRLRCVLWKQWKRGRIRFKELRQRGVGKDLAAETAGSRMVLGG